MLQISTLFFLFLSIETSVFGENASDSTQKCQNHLRSSANEINSPNKSNVCLTEICLSDSQKMLNLMDATVDPCMDFYEFACGRFRRNTVFPDNQESVTSFTMVKDKVRDQMHSVLSKNSNSTEPNAIRLTKMFAKSCFDGNNLNEKGELKIIFFCGIRHFKTCL